MLDWLRWLTWGKALTGGGTVATGATWVLYAESVQPKFVTPMVASIAATLYVVEIVRLRSATSPDLDALERQRSRIEAWAVVEANHVFPNQGTLDMARLEAQAFALHYPRENALVTDYQQALRSREALSADIHTSAVQHAADFGEVATKISGLLDWAAMAIISGNHSYVAQALQVTPHEGHYILFGKTLQTQRILGVECPMELELARADSEDALTDQRNLLIERLRAVEEWEILARIRAADDVIRATAPLAATALGRVHSLVKINQVRECPMCRNL